MAQGHRGLGLRGHFLLRGPQQPEPQGSLRLGLGGLLQLALGGWLLGAAPLLGGNGGNWHLGIGRWGRHHYLGGELQSGDRTQEGLRNLGCLFLLFGGHL